jgi:hypothetical protein
MPVSVTCPSCGHRAAVPDALAGKVVRCPKCGDKFRVTKPGSAPAAGSSNASAGRVADSRLATRPSKARRSDIPERALERDEDLVPSRFVNEEAAGRRFPVAMVITVCSLAASLLLGAVLAVLLILRSAQDPSQAGSNEKAKDPIPVPPVLTEKQKSTAADAIKVLARIEGAVQVGVNFRRYTELVGDAKAVVNEAEGALPAGEMKSCLSRAMRAYQDAGLIWNDKIQYPNLGRDMGVGKEISERYKFDRLKESPSQEVAMQFIWMVARGALKKARSLQ